MIFTSYFAQIRNFTDNIVPLSIAQYPPKWYTGACTKLLAPPSELLLSYKGQGVSEEEYTKVYTKKIVDLINSGQFDLNKLADTVIPFTGDGLPVKDSQTNHLALCCFEKPTDFCHRHILASILSDYQIANIQELSKEMIAQLNNPKIDEYDKKDAYHNFNQIKEYLQDSVKNLEISHMVIKYGRYL